MLIITLRIIPINILKSKLNNFRYNTYITLFYFNYASYIKNKNGLNAVILSLLG